MNVLPKPIHVPLKAFKCQQIQMFCKQQHSLFPKYRNISLSTGFRFQWNLSIHETVSPIFVHSHYSSLLLLPFVILVFCSTFTIISVYVWLCWHPEKNVNNIFLVSYNLEKWWSPMHCPFHIHSTPFYIHPTLSLFYIQLSNRFFTKLQRNKHS